MNIIQGIRAIAFDTDGTLVDFEKVMYHSLDCTLRELVRHHPGASAVMSIGKMKEIRDEVAAETGANNTSLEEIRLESFRRIVAAAARPDESLAVHLYQLYMKHRYEDIEIYDDVIPVLSGLKGKYILGLHSNGNSYPDLCGLKGFFDFSVFAQDYGVIKPEPGFYRIVLKRAGCSSNRLLNVGDSLHNDVTGAAESGIQSVWLNRNGETKPNGIDVEYEIRSLSELPGLLG